MTQLNWVKYPNGAHPSFIHLNTSQIQTKDGVYVIWHMGPKAWTVRVGQGDIAARLAEHQRDLQI